jgi:hypothetical protein
MGFMTRRGKTSGQQSAFGSTDPCLRRTAATLIRGVRGEPASLQRMKIAEMQRQGLFPSDVTGEHLADFHKLDRFLNPPHGAQSYL